MTRHKISHRDCQTVVSVLSLVGDKWTTLVVSALKERPHRFNELKRAVDSISQQALTRTLKALERDGLVKRVVHPTLPPQVEYRLSDLGHSLAEPALELTRWAADHLPVLYANRERYDRANQG